MIILNAFGESIRFWICDLSHPRLFSLKKYQEESKIPWSNIAFNLFTLKDFGFNHWSELSAHKENHALLLKKTNRMEIKKQSRTLMKFSSIELLNDQTLFPLFNTNRQHFYNSSSNLLLLIQYETGFYGKFQLCENDFRLYNLKFSINSLPFLRGKFTLSKIEYCNKPIQKTKNDSLITRFEALLI